MNSEAYADLIEEVVQRYGGMQRVCEITSDSTPSCVKAKASLMNVYPKVVSIPDQSHIADLVMKDFANLVWIRDVLDKVSYISKVVKGKRKLLSRFRKELGAHDNRVRTTGVDAGNGHASGEAQLESRAPGHTLS